MTLCIRSRRVLLGRGAARIIAPASLQIEDSLIVSVDTQDPASYEGGRAHVSADDGSLLDLGDHVITPAFINVHTHLALGFLRGAEIAGQASLVEDLFFRHERLLTADDVLAFTRMGAYESLLHGVGLAWDHYYHGQAVAQALAETGLAGVVAPTLQDLAGPGAGSFERALSETVAIAQNSDLQRRGIFAAVGPHATDTVSPELLKRALDLAQRHTLPVHMHVAQSLQELERVTAREGCSPLAWLDAQGVLSAAPSLVLAHALFASAADLSLLDPSRHLLALCPFSQLLFGFTAPVGAFRELGLAWAIATDCAASNDAMNLQKELRLAASLPNAGITSSPAYAEFFRTGSLAHAAEAQRTRDQAHSHFAEEATPQRLLERVWELPGGAHPSFRAGAIEPGCLANLIAWDTDAPEFWPETDILRALAYGDTTRAIHALWVAGRRIGRAGDFHRSIVDSDDYCEARLEANERLVHLMRRVP